MSKRNRDRRGEGQRPQGRRNVADDRADLPGQDPDDTAAAAERAALRADLENPDDESAGAAESYPGGAPESQHERWLKYGSNVVLVCVVVVVLAVLVTWLAQHPKAHAQIDTTKLKLYSLKPQTLQVIKNLKDNEKIEIVSLYTEKDESDDITAEQRPKMDYAGPVKDLLQEYKRNSNNITVDIIDPVANPAKVDALIERVTNQYGGEVKRYQDFLSNWPKTFKPVKEAVGRENAEVDRMQSALESSGGGMVSLAVQSVG